ncbi:hypothetical protein BSBH6_02191 [Bacillus subtilis]|nr:hypothetical protein BSBH6_02191 [Bacillus subtilis]RPK25087.1 hypothetical protein BH5_01918 [Bacillus subtilis]
MLHLKDAGMSMKELKQYTAWRAMGDKTIHERMHLLEKCKRIVEVEIQALQQNLLVLNRKIEFYKEKIKGINMSLSFIQMKSKSHKNKWCKAEGDF